MSLRRDALPRVQDLACQATGLESEPAACKLPNMDRIVGIIPARWNSTRFPGKPLHAIAGKPLLRHVWEACRRAGALDSVIIATDDMRVAEAAFSWGAEVSLTNADHASGTDRIAEVAKKMRGVSHVINVQGDEPLVDPKLINQLARKMQRDPQIEMITAVHPFADPAEAESPHQVKAVLDRKGRALYFSRSRIPWGKFETCLTSMPQVENLRHPSPIQYFRHQGIYGYRRDLLLRFVRWRPTPLEKAEALEQLRALENGVNIHVVVTASGSPGVDTPEDARAIERQLLARSGRPRQAPSR
jgi:3-deoxy-manno-octulosonate cytidylyltransferase (CMP-KDO synthetase)